MGLRWSKIDSFLKNYTSEKLTELRSCPICGSTNSKKILEYIDLQFFTDSTEVPKRANVIQRQCLDCFCIYMNPVYTGYGYRVLFAEASYSYGNPVRYDTKMYDWLKQKQLIFPGMSVLDLGCNEGEFLSKLDRRIKKVGVERNRIAVTRGRKKYKNLNLKLINSDIESFTYPGKFDLVTMFHILEHLTWPVAVLRKIRTLLKPEGRLLIEVPILENEITTDIHWFFSGQHTTHFTKNSLENCLALAGYKIAGRKIKKSYNYNGYLVLATKGEIRKISPDPNVPTLVEKKLSYWRGIIERINRKFYNLRSKNCVIWGGGGHTETLFHLTDLFKIKPDRKWIIVDNDPHKIGKTWRGIPIYPKAVLKKIDWLDTKLVISTFSGEKSIITEAIALGIKSNNIIRLYDDIPVEQL